jgi:hypothetical protein
MHRFQNLVEKVAETLRISDRCTNLGQPE